jgi:hypothetical protein
MRKLATFATMVLLLIALPVFAQQPNPAPDLFVSLGSNDFYSIIQLIGKSLIGLVGVISVFYVIYGGFQYLTSGFNAAQAEQGKKTIRNAVIGLIVVILSYIIVTVVVNSLSVPEYNKASYYETNKGRV